MHARAKARQTLENALRAANIEAPSRSTINRSLTWPTKRVTCLEALLRWHHPEKGLISPSEFIPLAEEIKLIVTLGEWVLRRACTDAVSWPNAVNVAVNLSPVQFRY